MTRLFQNLAEKKRHGARALAVPLVWAARTLTAPLVLATRTWTAGLTLTSPLVLAVALAGTFGLCATTETASAQTTEPAAQAQSETGNNAALVLAQMRQVYDSISKMDVNFSFESTMLGRKITGTGIFKKNEGSFRHEITYVLKNGQNIKTTVLLDDVNHLLWSDQPLLNLKEPLPYSDEQFRYYRLNLDTVDRFVAAHQDILPKQTYPWYRRCWLENLINGLLENFDFNTAKQISLSINPQTTEANTANALSTSNVQCYQLEGHWKKDRLEKLQSNRRDKLTADMMDRSLGMLVANEIPTEVILYLDASLLPYRIEFSRSNKEGAAMPPHAWIQFYNLVSDLNRVVHFSSEYFHFNTTSYRNVNDLTGSYLKELENQVKAIEEERNRTDEETTENRTFQ